VLDVKSVRHRYGGTPVLAAPDFGLPQGEHAVLLGPSGSGKTTLLHVLAGILQPAEGRVMLDGEDLHAPGRDDRWRAARIGMVPQRLHLIAALSAVDNVRLAQRRPTPARCSRNWAWARTCGGGRPSCRRGSSSAVRSPAR
jgi:putative ABC transport system ATP-binding protein